MGGLWGAVCEDQFEDVDALVACRHLGFPTESEFVCVCVCVCVCIE